MEKQSPVPTPQWDEDGGRGRERAQLFWGGERENYLVYQDQEYPSFLAGKFYQKISDFLKHDDNEKLSLF